MRRREPGMTPEFAIIASLARLDNYQQEQELRTKNLFTMKSFILCLMLATAARAQTNLDRFFTAPSAATNLGYVYFTNRYGSLIEGEVLRVDNGKLQVKHSGVVTMIKFSDTPTNIQSRFGYDPDQLNSKRRAQAELLTATIITNELQLKFTPSTNKFPAFWQPNAGQRACGDIYFKTELNEFDQTIEHRVFNFDDDFVTMLSRKYKVGPAEFSDYRLMVINYSESRQRYVFDESKPLEFMVDGERFSFTDKSTVVIRPSYNTELRAYSQSYHCPVNEFLVRKLGDAGRASIRVPTQVGNLDHQFTPLELRRFKLFALNFLPEEPAIK
jgi:hypothetical protein